MSAVIFDFDGTIADSFEYVFDFLQQEAGGHRPKQLKEIDYRRLSMKDMALKLGIPFWRLPFLYFKGRRVMRGHIMDVQPFPGMPEVIRELRANGHILGIVSSNSNRNIKKFLKKQGLHSEFKAVRGGAGLLGKVGLIRQLQLTFRAKDLWYVGDEPTDIASAKAAKVKSIAVTWGFGATDTLRRYEPTGLADQPSDIPERLAGRGLLQ